MSNLLHYLKFAFFCMLFMSLKAQKIPLIIDADTANEVDDLYALVGALAEPRFDLLGLTAAQFHTSPYASQNTALESHKINADLLRLTKVAIPNLIGSPQPLFDKTTAAPSEASQFIIEKAQIHTPENPLSIIILGSCTNVASALIEAPEILKNIKVYYLGFWHDPKTNSYNKKEFNTGNDPIATNLLLDMEGLDLTVMTATTSQKLVFKKKDVTKMLSASSELGTYLLDRWETYTRWWTTKDPEKKEWIMWDVAIIEALATPDLVTKKVFLTPKENKQRNIIIYTAIDVPKTTGQYWSKIADLL